MPMGISGRPPFQPLWAGLKELITTTVYDGWGNVKDVKPVNAITWGQGPANECDCFGSASRGVIMLS